MAASFLTQGRLALIEALRADLTLRERIREVHWFTWGSGLRRRLVIEPSECPCISIAPAEGGVDLLANVVAEIPQVVQVNLYTAGQNVEPMEDLLAALYNVVATARVSCLGLASEGLSNVQTTGTTWLAIESTEGAELIWNTTTNVRLTWRRLRPLTE